MADKYYKDTIGTEIIVDCGSVITGATGLALEVKKPDGKKVSWTPTIYDSNYLKYTIEEDDWDQAGTYKLQASLTINGWTGLGETATFEIHDAYK